MPLARMPPVRRIAGLVIFHYDNPWFLCSAATTLKPRMVVAQRRGNRKRIMPSDVCTERAAARAAGSRRRQSHRSVSKVSADS